MARRILPSVRQHETHRQLVGRARPGGGRAARASLDAIIVPASRTADNLDHAVTLAQAIDCWLVVLCSRQTQAADVGQLLSDKRFTKGLAVDVPHDYHHPLLTFMSSELVHNELRFCVNPNGDLSTKRNLGLLLARMLGWNRIFFMDDDVRDVSLEDLRATVSMLDRYRSAGMRVTDYADNSVVCHAHRETGAIQDVFVSGSVLAVNCQQPIGFFPEIYNEDWLFFYDDVSARRLGWWECDVTQLPYNPFENLQRAERQEFGDVLAEGLYALLHTGSGTAEATRDYWNKFLATRKKFLEDIIGRADSVAPDIGQNIVRAVQTAMLSLMQVQPKTCEDYVAAWQMDLQEWAKRLDTLPKVGSVEAAIEALGLTSIRCDYPVVQASPSTAYDVSHILGVFLDAHKAVSNLIHILSLLGLARRWPWIEQTSTSPQREIDRSQKRRATISTK